MKLDALYIETTSLEDNLSITVDLALYLKVPYFAIWFYPEIPKKQKNNLLILLKKYKYKEQVIEPITYYDGEEQINKKNYLFVLNKESKAILLKHITTLNKVCDALAFYKEQTPQWVINNIFHENIIVIKNSKPNREFLSNSKINFSQKPPTWW